MPTELYVHSLSSHLGSARRGKRRSCALEPPPVFKSREGAELKRETRLCALVPLYRPLSCATNRFSRASMALVSSRLSRRVPQSFATLRISRRRLSRCICHVLLPRFRSRVSTLRQSFPHAAPPTGSRRGTSPKAKPLLRGQPRIPPSGVFASPVSEAHSTNACFGVTSQSLRWSPDSRELHSANLHGFLKLVKAVECLGPSGLNRRS